MLGVFFARTYWTRTISLHHRKWAKSFSFLWNQFGFWNFMMMGKNSLETLF